MPPRHHEQASLLGTEPGRALATGVISAGEAIGTTGLLGVLESRADRITSTARTHKLSSSRIREALTNAVFHHMDEDVANDVGTDRRDLVMELGIVADDRDEGYAIPHAMPREWRNR